MTFTEARDLLDDKDIPAHRVERFAITGGMARHLAELGQGDLRAAVCRSVLDRRGPLFNDPRAVLEQELRQPATYFSVLEELADGEKSVEHLARATSTSSKTLSRYLATLEAMRLVSARLSIGAQPDARGRRYRIDDGFIRFWFRFVSVGHVAVTPRIMATFRRSHGSIIATGSFSPTDGPSATLLWQAKSPRGGGWLNICPDQDAIHARHGRFTGRCHLALNPDLRLRLVYRPGDGGAYAPAASPGASG